MKFITRRVSSSTNIVNLISTVYLISKWIYTTSVNKLAKLFKNKKLIKNKRYFGETNQYALHENYDI